MNTAEHIIALEWEMFQTVQNEGGRAPCQDDYVTFRLMRESQFSAWPEPVLASYQSDLQAARTAGRNLVMEKYARMMERSAPDRFAEIAPFLPTLDGAARETITRIMELQQKWIAALAARYPHIAGRGRAASSAGDGPFAISSETYLRSELATYSGHTLELLLAFLEDADREGRNPTEEIIGHTVKGYGYAGLAEAEAALAGKNR